ncbi:hypothetical protein [Allorhizocola rhizosphaerae]|uniref:hypothetical protein n=1 Tax=Allorhizocola rhizosphaerae TaxID=1872709 RepID=UPI000E3B651E|nr:hypothetical protein [Allorhizocola rhizosphaerae]
MGSVKKASWYSAAVVGIAMAMVGVTAAPALAAADVYHGEDRAWTTGADGKTLWVQDNECDGHGVTGEYYTRSGNFGSFQDSDGCGGDIEWRNSWDGDWIDRIRVCEQTKGCSAWEKS